MSKHEFTALVTGGASGIGEATARKLASRGISVLIGDMNRARGEKVAAEIRELYGVRAAFYSLDVTDEANVKAFVEHATQWTGRLDFAANCAGICENVWDGEESITAELFDQTHAVNTKGVWLCQKYEAAQMLRQEPRPVVFSPPPPPSHVIPGQRGSIANVASVSGLHANGLAAYTPSKYAVVAVTKNGAKFYGPSGVRCNAVCPGYVMTPMTEHSMGEAAKPGTKENEAASTSLQVAMGRMGFPQEQANLLSFLLSDESSYMNGSIVVNDGGFHDIR
ncbi:hypothetical protein AYO20_00403 [Fonsecaea nubica]|uniref:Uncharacterized protein n=1 Tax=Fonsecaea nubica TaxID=856822 RepID=A0A178DG74_9EURO|nr:hypothetical protein AYO20_00403 [Fonsecaea nubica]OAL40667.1 hypothetical protein AYO20_00403 [Fonsecaea nubica]